MSLSNIMPHSMFTPKKQYTINQNYQVLVPGDLRPSTISTPFLPKGLPAGQTIVVVEDTDLRNTVDWTVFRSTFGLSRYTQGSLGQAHPSGGTGGTCSDPGDNGDDEEAALDIEWASAAAPNAAIELRPAAIPPTLGASSRFKTC